MRFSLGGKGDHRSYGGCLVGGVLSIATVVTLLEVLMNRSIAVKGHFRSFGRVGISTCVRAPTLLATLLLATVTSLAIRAASTQLSDIRTE